MQLRKTFASNGGRFFGGKKKNLTKCNEKCFLEAMYSNNTTIFHPAD
jgi:hypothetical protein